MTYLVLKKLKIVPIEGKMFCLCNMFIFLSKFGHLESTGTQLFGASLQGPVEQLQFFSGWTLLFGDSVILSI